MCAVISCACCCEQKDRQTLMWSATWPKEVRGMVVLVVVVVVVVKLVFHNCYKSRTPKYLVASKCANLKY